jgi:DNA invertase Pin-like site-specific DNA recombinase
MRTAAYIRVSTIEQNDDLQRQALVQWARAKGVDLIIYADAATGTDFARPSWQRLESDIDAGRIQQLVVWKIDRLGRTASGLTQLFDKFNRLGVRFTSITEGLDLGTHMGKLVATVLAGVAEWENAVRRERQAAGIAAAHQNGRTWGGSVAGRLSAKVAKQADAVRALRASGMTIERIADTVSLSYPTVAKLLRSGTSDH